MNQENSSSYPKYKQIIDFMKENCALENGRLEVKFLVSESLLLCLMLTEVRSSRH